MSLDEYRQKRKFSATPEPDPDIAPDPDLEPDSDQPDPSGSRAGKLCFVVQKHAASHLHYDFRLEMDGVLKSWAVPKGVPDVPKVRRLAVETEDHPLAYVSFEGVIPKGQYGAGTVEIWDTGDYRLEDRSGEKIVFELDGQRLKGRYALIHTQGKNWILMKTDHS
ncbi:MAG: DNA polymerase ligase N-terminal domain-containing protein [bacterium]